MVRRVRPLEVCKAARECLSATGHKWDSGSDAWRGPQEGAAQAAALAAAIAPKQNLSVCKTVKVGPWHLGARIRTISAGVSGRGRRYGASRGRASAAVPARCSARRTAEIGPRSPAVRVSPVRVRSARRARRSALGSGSRRSTQNGKRVISPPRSGDRNENLLLLFHASRTSLAPLAYDS